MPRHPQLRVLTPAESDALRSVISRPRDRAAISLMLDAGLRASEVVTLTLDSIDWTDQVLRFTGKGDKAAELPINSRLRDALERAIQARPPQATHPYFLYDLRHPHKPITRFALLKLVKRYARKAGLRKRVFCHLLRHTFGTNVFRETGDLGRTQAAMRHSKIATTTIYMHLTPEDQRPDFERLDTRPWVFRWWSRLKPNLVPELLRSKPKPFYIGDTIGREKELTQLRQCVRNLVHTVLVGERGVGRRHLLWQLVGGGTDIYRVEAFSPVREGLVTLCLQLHNNELLDELPNGRGDTIYLDALRAAGRGRQLTLVIDSINDLGRKEGQKLRKLAETWTIVTSIDPRQVAKLGLVFFGHYHRIDLGNFDKPTALTFARKAMASLPVPDTTAYLNHLYAQSQGNPQAILELIDVTRKTGTLAPTHAALQQVLPASFFLALFLMVGIVLRYSASALSEPTVRIYAVIFIVINLVLTGFDKILKAKAR